MQALNACTAAFVRLESLVHQAEAPTSVRPRTIEEEDHIAPEVMILETEGPDPLARYQRRWAAGVR